ncbi:MAG: HD domain-containing protein [Ruminococcaceae bacterium]|nr:HD domain-containing protein [Oscillospiraceae bacterium]
MKNFTQHGNTSVFEHCVSVAKFSLLMAHYLEKTLRIKVDRDSLVRAALLHDYFLYDWHDKTVPGHNIHGFTHPGAACRNADRDFGLNEVEKDIISKHMFPLTIMPPKYRESVIVTLADKWCALCETFKVDVSSYIIYRVNCRIEMANNELQTEGAAAELDF